METKQRYCFKKEERLKSHKQIEQLFKEGKSFSLFPFRITWMYTNKNAPPLQTGFTASSRNFKKAVDRNRIKRLAREAYRLQKNDLQNQLIQQQKSLAVFIIYTGNQLPEYKLVFEKMGSALKRLIKMVHENTAADS